MAKDLKRFFIHTKIYEWLINLIPHYLSLEECKLKLQGTTTMHTLEWLWLVEYLVREDMEQLESLYFVGETVQWYNYFVILCQFLIKLKVHLLIDKTHKFHS